ncbi:MAG: transposase [Deltaproteobacteria bacterium]|nr:transposase [Deltaproteobacteria bacterium]
MENKLFFILYYLKNYPTFDVLGYKFDLDRSKACTNVHKLTPILQTALRELGVLPKRKFSSANEMAEAFKNVEDLFIDATERLHFRHKDYEKQKENYSGKQKGHTVKNTVIADACKTVLFLGYTVSGSMHDYGLLKNEFPQAENWFENFNLWIDLGYLGIQSDYESISINIPDKKPRKSKSNPFPCLTKEQKEKNKNISKVRVVVENAIGGMKRFNILTTKFRNKITGFVDDVAILAAGLWNLKLSMKK